MSKKIYDCVVVTGEYTNLKGEKKKNYLTIGAVFEGDKGLSMKLDALPTHDFNGWISFYQPKDRVEKATSDQNSTNTKGLADLMDDIPF